jgi:hypothetical protein
MRGLPAIDCLRSATAPHTDVVCMSFSTTSLTFAPSKIQIAPLRKYFARTSALGREGQDTPRCAGAAVRFSWRRRRPGAYAAIR